MGGLTDWQTGFREPRAITECIHFKCATLSELEMEKEKVCGVFVDLKPEFDRIEYKL